MEALGGLDSRPRVSSKTTSVHSVWTAASGGALWNGGDEWVPFAGGMGVRGTKELVGHGRAFALFR